MTRKKAVAEVSEEDVARSAEVSAVVDADAAVAVKAAKKDPANLKARKEEMTITVRKKRAFVLVEIMIVF